MIFLKKFQLNSKRRKYILLTRFLLIFYFLLLYFFLRVSLALARVTCTDEEVYIGIFDTCWDIEEALGLLVQAIIDLAFAFVGVLALVKLAWGGVRYITSRANPDELEGAKGTITAAIAGLLIVLGSFIILKILESLLAILGIEFFVLPDISAII